MRDTYIFVKESQAKERREARAQIYRALAEGKTPGLDDMARARGMVVRERENSIFSDSWMFLAIVFLLIGLIANRNPAMLALSISLFVIAGVGTWWKRASLHGVVYERTYDRTHAFPGEAIEMTLTISNRKPLPLTWLQFRDEIPVAPITEGKVAMAVSQIAGGYMLQNSLSMLGFETTRRRVTMEIPRRGFYDIGPVRIKSGDIFTLFTIERQHAYVEQLVIYPKVYPLETLALPAKEMFGDLAVRRSLFTDPIKTQGIRDYQPQDRFRDVHWKATARRGNLQTKVYDPSSAMAVVPFLNVATYPKHWMGFDPDLLERAISVTASIASYAAEQKWRVGVYANGSIPGSDQPIRVPPGRSPDQLTRILEALAAVTEFATGSVELLMHRESPRLPWAATLVLVTAVVTDEILIGLLRLKEAGRRVVLISLADEPLPRQLHGILCYHVPAPGSEGPAGGSSPSEEALGTIPVPQSETPEERMIQL